MDSIKLSTPQSFSAFPSSPKRKKHTTIACEPCRKLKIRCLGGGATAIGSAPVVTNPCNHCASLSKQCVWPQEDGRKRARTSSPGTGGGEDTFPRVRRDETSSVGSMNAPPTPLSTESSQAPEPPADHRTSSSTTLPPANTGTNENGSLGGRSDSSASETPNTTVH